MRAALTARMPKVLESEQEVVLSYLPLAHIYGRILESVVVRARACVLCACVLTCV